LCVAQGIQQAKEDQCDEQNINYAQPTNALKYKKEVVEEFSHSIGN